MLNKLDFFGKAVLLKFNGSQKSQTRAGAIFTLLFLTYIIWSIYHVGKDIVLRRDPRTVTSESFQENPEPMIISPETFSFGFGLQNPDTFDHYIDESIYTVEVSHNQQRRVKHDDGNVEAVWTTTSLEVETCTPSHFGNIGEKFINIGLDKILCLKRDQPNMQQIRIQGVFESPTYEYVSVAIKQCFNHTSNGRCASQDKINSLLLGGWYAVYYPNMAVDPKNYTHPNLKYRDSAFTTVGNNYFKEISMWLSHIEVSSDLGWLTTNEKTSAYIKLDQIKEMTNFRQDPDGFMRFTVRVGKVTQHHSRSYIKVEDISAQVNGLATFGLLAAIIFVVPYSNLKFYESLINELFDIKTLQKGKKTSNKKNVKSNKQDNKIKKKVLCMNENPSPTPEKPLNMTENKAQAINTIEVNPGTKFIHTDAHEVL